MFKLKYKKCDNCIYHYKTDILDCCYKPDKYGLKLLRPKKHICFNFKNRKDMH